MDRRKNSALEEKEFTNTSIDLGEDLLHPDKQQSTADIAPVSDAANQLEQAEILEKENLYDDAKKILRKILIQKKASSDLIRKAQDLLDKIHLTEEKQLLHTEKKFFSEVDNYDKIDVARLIAKLDYDLRLDFQKEQVQVIPDLFKDKDSLEKYIESIHALDLSFAEQKDLGIAFLVMDIYPIALALFEVLARNEKFRIEATYLIGVCLLQANRAVEATIRLAPMVKDVSLDEQNRCDFLYLMGRAFEMLGDKRKAKEFFKKIYKAIPRYKDVSEKIK
ncbi:MAG: tol-pal system YbgF family protein [Bacteriovoracia bacterium]